MDLDSSRFSGLARVKAWLEWAQERTEGEISTVSRENSIKEFNWKEKGRNRAVRVSGVKRRF